MGKILRAWSALEKLIVGILGLAATILAFSAVITRYFFSFSPEWLTETVIYLVIWAVFIVASTLAAERGHVGASFFVEKLPPPQRRILEILTGLLAVIFCILIGYWGFVIVCLAYATDERSLTLIRYPLWIFYLAVPVGLMLVAGRYLMRIYRLIFRFNPSDLLEHHEMSRKVYLKTGSDQKT